MFALKMIIAYILSILKISDFFLLSLNKKNLNNYVRIINYHDTPEEERENFEKQIKWYKSKFKICGFTELKKFLDNKIVFDKKPGLLITFDDGFLENYNMARDVLKRNNVTAGFMVSTGLVGKVNYNGDNGRHDYMNTIQLKNLIAEGNFISCHTYSHHRMSEQDDEKTLILEIEYSKKELEKMTETVVESFCWCGGEEETYTLEAAKKIKNSGYEYAFMTNSSIIRNTTNKYQLDRSNIETNWPIALVKLQVSGLMDLKFRKKRERIHRLTSKL